MVVMFTLVGSLLLKQMQHNVYFGKKSPIKKNYHLAAKLLTTYYILKLKNAYDKLWDKFHLVRKAYDNTPLYISLVKVHSK